MLLLERWKYHDKNMVKNSAVGIAIHTPVTPKSAGSVKRDTTINPKVLIKEMIAEVFPSERAVKSADENILNPLNKKARENRENPSTASA